MVISIVLELLHYKLKKRRKWENINEKFIIIWNDNVVFFEKSLRRREIKQDYPKQSTHLKSTTKKYYVNGTIE